jgi:hypothetical protein
VTKLWLKLAYKNLNKVWSFGSTNHNKITQQLQLRFHEGQWKSATSPIPPSTGLSGTKFSTLKSIGINDPKDQKNSTTLKRSMGQFFQLPHETWHLLLWSANLTNETKQNIFTIKHPFRYSWYSPTDCAPSRRNSFHFIYGQFFPLNFRFRPKTKGPILCWCDEKPNRKKS